MSRSCSPEADQSAPDPMVFRHKPTPLPPSWFSRSLSLLFMASVLAAGCSHDPTTSPVEPEDDPASGEYDDTPISDLTVAPSGLFIPRIGLSFKLSAAGTEAAGGSIPEPLVEWSSLNPEIATVEKYSGLVSARGTGQATIMAQGNGAAAYALVTVSAPDLGPVSRWRIVNEPHPYIASIWGSPEGDFFAVGSSGALYHFDGSVWREVESGVDEFLMDVWGTSSADVFAVGRGGTLLHYDGLEWNRMESGTDESLAGVWANTPEDVFAVGERGGILHFDGTAWSYTAPVGGCRFTDIHGTSGTNVFAVGCAGRVFRYDGSAWTGGREGVARRSPWGVWVVSEDDVWVVGNGISHFDGQAWHDVEAPSASLWGGIWGTPSGELFAVGLSGTILEYDGTTWIQMESGTGKDLDGVWGTSASSVFAVGEGNTILHFDGTAWSTVRTGISASFGEIWGSSPEDLYAVGSGHPPHHFDGSIWREIQDPLFHLDFPQDVWGTSSSDVYFTHLGTGALVGHFNGSAYEKIAHLGWNGARSIWGTSPTDVFIVGAMYGDNGEIHHFDGLGWSKVAEVEERHLLDVWGTSPSDVYSVGLHGAILHFDGTQWVEMASGTDQDVGEVWGTSPTNVFAVGKEGTILHFDGISWERMDSGTAQDLVAVRGTSPSDVFAGGGGVLLHFDGTGWSPVAEEALSRPGASVGGIWIDSDGEVVVVGGYGTILRGVR